MDTIEGPRACVWYGRITIVIQVSAIGGRRCSVLAYLHCSSSSHPPLPVCRAVRHLACLWRAGRHLALCGVPGGTMPPIALLYICWATASSRGTAPDQPFFSRGTNRLLLLVGQLCRTVSCVVGEQFLGVSSCFVQCFVHNKHPRDRPPQQILPTSPHKTG